MVRLQQKSGLFRNLSQMAPRSFKCRISDRYSMDTFSLPSLTNGFYPAGRFHLHHRHPTTRSPTIYLSKLHKVFFQISNCICPNSKLHLFKLLNVFVQITNIVTIIWQMVSTWLVFLSSWQMFLPSFVCTYLSKLKIYWLQLRKIFVQIAISWQMVYSRLASLSSARSAWTHPPTHPKPILAISKVSFTSTVSLFKMYLSKLINVFVKIDKSICTNPTGHRGGVGHFKGFFQIGRLSLSWGFLQSTLVSSTSGSERQAADINGNIFHVHRSM